MSEPKQTRNLSVSDRDLMRKLKEVFGYSRFRSFQKEVIKRTLQNDSSLVIMPTGGGKSICYQLPALLFDGLSIVISPLISLMQDQVTALRANGVAAGFLNSSLVLEEELATIKDLEDKRLKLLYISPEKAVSPGFLEWISTFNIAQIAIDEAHCVSIWGNDFRQEYTQLIKLLETFPNVPVVALTATADKATQDDICQQLRLTHVHRFIASFERPNLELHVLPAQNRFQHILSFINKHQSAPGIIYCLSRRSTEELSMKLNQAGLNTAFYHAALDAKDRNRIQDDFIQDNTQIICATIAFGMGIDKPNIAWVIHYNLPKNIEGYYQEIGRAGRNGHAAETLLFAGYRDMKTLKEFIQHSQASQTFKNVQEAKLQRMWSFTQASSCRTNFILNYFGEYKTESCGHCDNCLNPPQRFDGTILAQIALSACVRLKQDVSIFTLIDVLRGSKKHDIIQQGYNQIKTYGLGKDIDQTHWLSYITQLIDQGLLAIDFTRHGRLFLTELARPVLLSQQTVYLSEPVTPQKMAKVNKATTQDLDETDQALFDSLSTLRRQIAEERSIKAHQVFSNASLIEMVKMKPTNEVTFSQISGVGEYKLKNYGKRFINQIAQF